MLHWAKKKKRKRNNKQQLSLFFFREFIFYALTIHLNRGCAACCDRSNTSQERSQGSPTCPMTASLIALLSLIYRFYRRPGSRAPGTPLPYPYNVHCLSKSWSEACGHDPLAPFGSLCHLCRCWGIWK